VNSRVAASLIFPTDLASFFELLRLHGDEAYGLIFAFAASHSMLLTLFAGYASSSGSLDLGTLVAVVWAGSFLGDTIRFGIGRFFGTQWLSPFPRLQRSSQIVVRLVDRYYVWLILFHRYPHGIRGVAGFAYGMSRLSWPTFLAFNFVAAGLWSGVVLSAGHAFGQVSEKLLNDAFSGIGMVMLIVFLTLSWVFSKKLERIAEQSK
jgi:membrane protein DedA with SNARE-associated domain